MLRLDDVIGVGLAFSALLMAVGGLLLVVQRRLDADVDVPALAGRGAGVAFVAVALVVLVGAAVLDRVDASDASTTRTSTAGAVEAVRDYVGAATVLRDGFTACGYLTSDEAATVTARIGPAKDCRTAVDEAGARARGLPDTSDALDALPARAHRHGRDVTVALGHRPGLVFALRPTTETEADASFAPRSAWRIAGGATSVFASEAAHAAR